MFKFWLSVFSLLVFVWAGPAWAKVQSFGAYSIDIPAGWTVSETKKLVTIVSKDQRLVFFITAGISQNHHSERVAADLPKYSHITSNNPKQKSTVTPLRWERVIVTILGDHPDRTKVYRSIKATK